jgi:hypothetical protein
MIDLYNLKDKIITLIFIIVLIYIIKPSITFLPNGKPREYGVGYDSEGYKKTFYTMQNLILLTAIIVYLR